MQAIILDTMPFDDAMQLSGRLGADTDSVHLWSVSLISGGPGLAQARALLSPQELERATRFHRNMDRDRHTLAHGVLRRLLGLYCDTDAGDLAFATAADGKPRLQSTPGESLTFNISHSSDRLLVGVTAGRQIGVDIEAMDRRTDSVRLANRYFFDAEALDIAAATGLERQDRFFQYWVAKEAALKAAGAGLGYPLDALQVRFSADRTRADVISMQPQRLPPDLTVQMMDCGPGWHAAAASRGHAWRCRPMPDPMHP